ncbi:MAG: ABC transporter permease [Chloroflexi bacterium]|nr:ABC transporter permease [Chloroflexota bacterium]
MEEGIAQQLVVGTRAATAQECIRLKQQSQLSIVLRQLRRNRGAIVGLSLLILEVLIAIAAPLVAPYNPLEQSPLAALKGPSTKHLFGTDDVGRDILSRVIYGARISLRVGLISVSIAATIGTTLGIIAGFYGGRLDSVIMGLANVLLAFPGILLALAIIAVLGPGLFNVMIAVGIGGIPTYIRVARGSTLSIRNCDYVTGARAVGCNNNRIMLRYILPNALPPLIVLMTVGVAGAILTASGLSFLGLGAQPPTPEWGAMLNAGRTYLRQAWWVAVFPGLAITITVLSINMLGDGLRDALDPKLRR